jgi:putative NADH-flavin reductase
MKLLVVVLVFAYGALLSIALRRAGLRARAASRAPAASAPTVPPARILVIGATGGTGRALVAQALERGHSVTALVRNPSALNLQHPRLRILQGDVLDYPSVEAAVQDQDAVISALGHKRYFSTARILSEGTRNVLRAMEARHVRRFVCETSLGIGDTAGRMGLYYTFIVIPFILPFYFWDKTRQERVVAESGTDWVVVRPGVLTNGAKRDRYRHGRRVGSFLWTVRISRSDVATFMLDQLTDNRYLRSAAGVCW